MDRNFESDLREEGILSWDAEAMLHAISIAQRSKDKRRQVGACIMDKRCRIVGLGYNGLPNNMKNSFLNWAHSTKNLRVVHAERNAILNSRGSVEDCILYVTLFPCNECAKEIIQAGIKEVVYLRNDTKMQSPEIIASKSMMKACGVSYRALKKEDVMAIYDYMTRAKENFLSNFFKITEEEFLKEYE